MKNFKKNNLIGVFFVAISILLSSCSKTPTNLEVVPESTNLVSVIDFYSILKKGKFNEISELKFFKAVKKEIRNENKKIYRLMDDIVEDPTVSGIDFKTDVFAYFLDEAKDEKFFCISVAIKDEDKFGDFIEDVLSKAGVEFDIEQEKTFRYTVFERELAVAWDKSKAVFLTAVNYKSRENLDLQIETLFSLKENDQISSNSNFNKFYKDKKDLNVWLSTDLYEDSYDFKKIERELDFDITDNFIAMHLNFDDDNISMLARLTPNKEIQKIIDENNFWTNTFNPQLFNYFPNGSYATASVSLSPMAYYKTLEQEDDFEKIAFSFKKETGLELEDVFKSFKGNALFSVFGFENVEYTYRARERTRYYDYKYVDKTEEVMLPIMGLAMDINGNKTIKKLIDKIPEDNINKRSYYYEFKIDEKYPAYLAFDEKICFITNDKRRVKAFKSGGLQSKNLKDSNLSEAIENSNFYSFVNLNYDNYPKEIKKKIKDNQNVDEQRLFRIWKEIADYIELKQIDGNTVELVLTTKNNKNNSLNTIITTINDNYKSLMSL